MPTQTTIERIVILGATGDLTTRYLLPALGHLLDAGELSPDFRVTAVARRPHSDESYREMVAKRLAAVAASVSAGARQSLVERLTYRRAELEDVASLREAIGQDPVVAYLALPPAAFAPAIRSLDGAGIHPDSRLVVEKPFGVDLESARALNELLHRTFPERSVYRIDHFLHHPTVQNILGLRFANRLFEPLWRAEHIARVDVTWDETMGIGGRAGYYDRTGALRDMIQNHLLQLLALVAMDAPARLDERDLRDQKASVLRAVRSMSADEVAARTTRGRYTSGHVDGQSMPDYVAEEGVDPRQATETYASVELYVDNWRWAGVPFRLRTGKALAAARRSIEITFRAVPHLAFGQPNEPRPNSLRLEMAPDRIVLSLEVNGKGDPFDLEPVELDVTLPTEELPAYARLLLDVLRGDPVLAIRDDEAEESWRIVEPILSAWQAGSSPLREYRAGSDGPEAGTAEAAARA